MAAIFRIAFPVTLTSAHPKIINTIPGQKRSPNLRPPRPNAIAFGGVLIRNGTPKEAETATKMAVDGSGISAVASGISRTAVAVLLIRAESIALVRHKINRPIVGSMLENGTVAARSLTIADCSRSLPSVIPPAIRSRVDQSIFTRSFYLSMPDKKMMATEPRATTAAGIP